MSPARPLLAVVLATLSPGALLAQTPEETPAKLVVDFAAYQTEDAWVAAAFEQNAYGALANHRVSAVDKEQVDTSACVVREPDCLLERYAAAGVDIILLGWVREGTLSFDVYEGWLKTRVGSHAIDIEERPSMLDVQRLMRSAVDPFLESGGLLEKKARILEEQSADLGLESSPSWVLIAWLGLLILLTSAPILLSRFVWRTRLRDRPSLPWSIALALLLAAALVARLVLPAPDLGWAVDWLLPMIGGSAWAWFVLLNLRLALPAIPGLGSVGHGNVGRLLRAWSVAAALRLLLLILFYGPFALALLDAPRPVWILLAPLLGLALHLLLLSFVDHLSAYLDRALVVGRASARNPWHPVIKKYFLGYVRRAGLEIDRSILDRTLFLPGRSEGIASYGGGLSSPRILVHESLLEVALHPLADEPLYEEEERAQALDPGDPGGMILPSEGGSELELRSGKRPEARRRRRVRPLLGQNETLLGYVVPQPTAESVPLVIDDPDEYAVLRDLLTAHYAAFDHGLYGEEADDTDPTQLDFLFGALLREIGSVQRQDTLLFTITLAFEILLARAPAWVRAVQRSIAGMYDRFLSRYPAIVADGYPALNRGLHHLIQYLFQLRTNDASLLTVRADEPTLASTSSDILRRVSEGSSAEDRRLIWLSQHLVVPIAERRSPVLRTVVTLALLFGLGGALAAAATRAIEYHPIYEERMRALEEKIEQARREGEAQNVREDQN